MKKIILVFVIGILAIGVNAQEVHKKDAPAAVSTSFNSAYAKAHDVDWKMEGSNYVAKFEMNDRDMFAVYDASGKLVESREELKRDDTPAAIMSYVKNTYKEDELKDFYRVTDANGTVTYRGKVKGKILTFDANGNMMN
jgi:hypothetical protein